MKCNKTTTLFIYIFMIFSCNSLAEKLDYNKNQSLLIGDSDTSQNTVLFRSLDKGPLLFDDDYNLPTSIVVEIGNHEISVMCEFNYEGGYTKVPGKFSINASENREYLITAKLSTDESSCTIDYK